MTKYAASVAVFLKHKQRYLVCQANFVNYFTASWSQKLNFVFLSYVVAHYNWLLYWSFIFFSIGKLQQVYFSLLVSPGLPSTTHSYKSFRALTKSCLLLPSSKEELFIMLRTMLGNSLCCQSVRMRFEMRLQTVMESCLNEAYMQMPWGEKNLCTEIYGSTINYKLSITKCSQPS